MFFKYLYSPSIKMIISRFTLNTKENKKRITTFSLCIVSPPTTINANEAPGNKKRPTCLIVGTTISINASHLFVLYILLCFS